MPLIDRVRETFEHLAPYVREATVSEKTINVSVRRNRPPDLLLPTGEDSRIRFHEGEPSYPIVWKEIGPLRAGTEAIEHPAA